MEYHKTPTFNKLSHGDARRKSVAIRHERRQSRIEKNRRASLLVEEDRLFSEDDLKKSIKELTESDSDSDYDYSS